jgi:di- and tripeptidase
MQLNIPAVNVIDPAHYGYIYCMTVLTATGDGINRLATGSGDESIKVVSSLPLLLDLIDRFI